MPDGLTSFAFLENLSYIGIFIAVFIAGYIVPIPEELLLLSIGYFASAGYFNPYIAGVVSLLAILASENMLFLLVKKGNRFITPFLNLAANSSFGKKLSSTTKAHIGKTVFVARFAVGMRFIGPTLAGLAQAKWKKFFLANFLALLIYVPLFLFVGYRFHRILNLFITGLDNARHVVFFLILLLLSVIIWRFARRKLGAKSSTIEAREEDGV